MIYTPSLQLANKLKQPNWGKLIGVGNPRYLVTRLMVQHWRRKMLSMYGLLGGFSPTDILGGELWLDFADVSSLYTDSLGTIPVSGDGDPIGFALDKFLNGNDATQGNGAAKPTHKTEIQNGLSVARFDGGDLLSISSGGTLDDLSAMSILIVVNQTNNGQSSRYFDKGQKLFFTEESLDDLRFVAFTSGDALVTSTNEDTPYGLSLLEHYWDGSLLQSGNNFYINNDVQTKGAAPPNQDGTGTLSSDAGDNAYIGNSAALDRDYEGDIMSILIYDSVLSATNRASLVTFLNDKWSIF